MPKVNSWLKEKKLDYIIDYGTLLGAVREKGFIEGDHDTDVSIAQRQ